MEKDFKLKLKAPELEEHVRATPVGFETKLVVIKSKNPMTQDDFSNLDIVAREWQGQELENCSEEDQDKVNEAINKLGSLRMERVLNEQTSDRKFVVKVIIDPTKSYRFAAKYRGKHILQSPIIIQGRPIQGVVQIKERSRMEKTKLEDLVDPSLAAARTSLSSDCTYSPPLLARASGDLNSNFSKLSPKEDFAKSQVIDSLSRKVENMKMGMSRRPMPMPMGDGFPELTSKKARLDEDDSPRSTRNHGKVFNFCNVKGWRKEFIIHNKTGTSCGVDSPIGMCILPGGKMVIASTFENKIKMFETKDGKLMKNVRCGGIEFDHPSDMVTLPSGGFAVRDRTRVMIYNNDGVFVENVMEKRCCYGLTVDSDGRLVCVESSRSATKLRFLKYDAADIQQTHEVDFSDLLTGRRDKSKLRFLTFKNSKYYITDLGLDKVFILEKDDQGYAISEFGSTGKGPGEFNDPAGVVVDSQGNMIVADSRNHRLCLFDAKKNFLRVVMTSPDVHRPSSLYFDESEGSLYVLGLGRRFGVMKLKPCF